MNGIGTKLTNAVASTIILLGTVPCSAFTKADLEAEIRRVEGGEAPVRQGATTENTGSI